jgi:tetratricopeptide (TPR) repeat protein
MTFVALCLAAACPVAAQDSKIESAVANAVKAIDSGKPEKAVEQAQKLAKAASAESLLGASRILAHAGKLEDAAKLGEQARAAQASPDLGARVLSHVARLEILRGTAKDALTHARAAVELQSSAQTLAVLALAQAHAKDAQAVSTAQKAAALAPDNAVVQDALGQALSAAGQYAEADAAFTRALALDPKLGDAHLHRAFLLLSQGKPAEAEAAARSATAPGPQQGIGYAVLGAALLAKDPNDPKAAELAIKEGAQAEFQSPHSAYVQHTVGTIYERMGGVAAAVNRYKEAAKIDPGYTPARVALVKAEYLAGNIDGALVEARTLADDNPGDGEAQLLYGLILVRKEDYAGALAPLERAAELLPTSHEVAAQLGKAYRLNRQYTDAVDRLKGALDTAPDNLEYRLEYATALAQAKQFDAAIAEFGRLTSTAGYRDPLAFLRLGYLVYLSQEPKKPAEAATAFQNALTLDPKNAQAAYGLGRAQLLAKQHTEAAASYTRAAELDTKLAAESHFMAARAHLEMAEDAKNKELLPRAEAELEKSIAAGWSATDPRVVYVKAAIERVRKGQSTERPKETPEPPKGPDFGDVAKGLVNAADGAIRSRAARACAQFGAECVPHLRPMLNRDADLNVRVNVARALGAIGAAASASCPELAKEIADSQDRAVFTDPNRRVSSEEEARRFGRELGLQNACRDARVKIGCR